MQFDVVVVGAGIGGAALALMLGRRGRRVAIVERESAAPVMVRPEILWGATVEALDRFGIRKDIAGSASVQLHGIEIGGAKPWLSISHEDFAVAGVDAYSTNPSMTRDAITRAALATGNVEIHRGVVVEDLVRDDGRVTGVRGRRGETPLAFEATLVVGDDGGGSIVRTKLGSGIALDTFPIEFVTAKIAQWPLPPHRARIWIDLSGLRDRLPAAGFVPWPAGEGVLLVPLTPEKAKRLFAEPAETFWNELDRVTPMAGAMRAQLEFPRDFTRVTRPFGHAHSYSAHGAVLIGDAAHPMTPAGGQGANAAIWDALALAGILDTAFRGGGVTREHLLAYERLRRPSNEASVSISRTARRAFRFAQFLPLTLLLPLVAKTAEALGWPKRRVIRSFSTTFVHS